MANCSKCGHQNPEGNAFCVACGSRLDVAANPKQSERQPSAAASGNKPKAPKKQGCLKSFLKFYLLCAAILAVIIGLIWYASDSNDYKSKDGRITQKLLDSFGSYDDIERTYDGNSSAIDITPTEGVHITAPKNAFARETQIKMSGVSDSDYDMLDKKCNEMGIELLLAYDLDAGMSDDEVMPGTYKVEFDLKKMGIPEEMWNDLAFYRVDANGNVTEYGTHVKDGIISYESSVNSKGMLASLGKWAIESFKFKNLIQAAIIAPVLIYGGTLILRQYILAPFRQYSTEKTFVVHVDDEYGDFNIIYNQRLCENGYRTSAYDEQGNAKDALVERRINELYGEAAIKCNKMVDEAGKANNAGYFQSQRQREAMRNKVNQLEEYKKLCATDKKLQALLSDEFFAPPESVLWIIEMEKLVNRYLVKEQGLERMSYTYDIYLSNDDYLKSGGDAAAEGVTVPVDLWKTFMAIRHGMIVEQGSSTDSIADHMRKINKFDYPVGTALRPEDYNSMLVTLCHETFHMQQYRYMFSTILTKDQRLCEATAVVLERQFTQWLRDKNVLNNSDDLESTWTTTDAKLHWVSWTMEKPIPTNAASAANTLTMIKTFFGLTDPDNTDMGYALGDFILYMLDKHKDKKVTLLKIFKAYKHSKGFNGMLRDAFGMTDEEFYQEFENYCRDRIKTITEKQSDIGNSSITHGFLDPTKKISFDDCYYRITNIAMKDGKAYSLALRTFNFEPKVERSSNTNMTKFKYNLFIVPSPAINPSLLRTTILNKKGTFTDKDSYTEEVCVERGLSQKTNGHVALLYRPGIDKQTIDGNWWVDVVAMFEPKEKPFLTCDIVRDYFMLYPKVTPPQVLVDKKYITGMQIAVINNENKKKKTYKIEVGDKWPKSIMAFCSDLDINPSEGYDVSITSRWYYTDPKGTSYYSPATEKANFATKGNKKKQAKIIEFRLNSVDGDSFLDADKTLQLHINDDGSFSLQVPPMTIPFKQGDGEIYLWTGNEVLSGFTLRGQMSIQKVGSFTQYTIDDSYGMEMSPFNYKKSINVFGYNNKTNKVDKLDGMKLFKKEHTYRNKPGDADTSAEGRGLYKEQTIYNTRNDDCYIIIPVSTKYTTTESRQFDGSMQQLPDEVQNLDVNTVAIKGDKVKIK